MVKSVECTYNKQVHEVENHETYTRYTEWCK